MATKLTNTQKQTIQEKLSNGDGISDIAKELKIPLSAVKAYLVTLFESLNKVKEIQKKAHEESESLKNIKNVMITKTRDQKRKGVAIMTKEASERVDEENKRQIEERGLKGDGGMAFRSRYTDTIFVIDPEKEN